jgi:hypothetical protein
MGANARDRSAKSNCAEHQNASAQRDTCKMGERSASRATCFSRQALPRRHEEFTDTSLSRSKRYADIPFNKRARFP